MGILFSLAILHAQDSQWNMNPYDYKYDMTVYATLEYEGTAVTDYSDYEIGAFVGDECRGVGEIQSKDGHEWIYLRIRSNVASGEIVQFRLHIKSVGETYVVKTANSIEFVSQGLVGKPSNPILLECYQEYSVEVKSADEEMGSAIGGGVYRKGAEATLIAEPATGYHFDKWSDETTDNPYKITVDRNLTLTAYFGVNQYTLTFDSNGGSSVDPITQDYHSAVSAPSAPVREGYTFKGWDKEIPELMPAENMTFTAQWQINSYKLVYIVDGEEYKTVDVEYGADIIPEATPEKEGYTFSGWSEMPETMPAHDVTVEGTFSPISGIVSVFGEDSLFTIYDMYGNPVLRNVTANELRNTSLHGLYIVNGKKIMLK